MKNKVVELDCDIIGDQFWTENPHLLEHCKDM